MGQPARKQERATYADVEAAPPNKVAELIAGELFLMARPGPRHAFAASGLGFEIGGPFHHGRGGPGGWVILTEPELHFPDPTAPGAIDAVAPDLAGWRVERMPELPDEAYFTLAPDWICEVLSPTSTEKRDRETKMPLYEREGVRHAWLLDPIARKLEVYVLSLGRWEQLDVYRNDDRVRAVPFDAIEFDLAVLWAKPRATR